MTEPRPFDPAAILATLNEHHVRYILIGGLGATLHGSPFVTTDVDITPAGHDDNLERLADALEALDARLRVEGEPDGIPFDRSLESLRRIEILTLTTRHGDLDISLVPSGTGGYDDLRRGAIELDIHGLLVSVASLADIIRSKEAAGREKDRLVLSTLRALLERIEEEEGE